MAVLLGGRAAEELVFGELSTGAADDLAKATDIARSMVTRYGMDADARQASPTRPSAATSSACRARAAAARFSEETAREIDLAVRELVERGYQQALEILKRRRSALEALARKLLEKETLTADELPRPTPPPEAEAA